MNVCGKFSFSCSVTAVVMPFQAGYLFLIGTSKEPLNISWKSPDISTLAGVMIKI